MKESDRFASAPSPKISVIIPTHQRPDVLVKALASFEPSISRSVEFEILIVSNLEDSETETIVAEAVKRNLPARYLVAGQLGVNCARNRGLESSLGEILYFFDDDCRIIHFDHLTQVYSGLSSAQPASILGGCYKSASEASVLTRAYNLMTSLWLTKQSLESNSIVHLGGNFAIRRENVGKARFDESIEYGGSEVSFQNALLAQGAVSRFDPSLPVEHSFQGTLLDFVRKAWKQGARKGRGTKYFRTPLEEREGNGCLTPILREIRDAGFVASILCGLYLSVAQTAWALSRTRTSVFVKSLIKSANAQ